MSLEKLKTLYPNLTPQELAEAEVNLERYLEFVWEICAEEDFDGHESSSYDESKGRFSTNQTPNL